MKSKETISIPPREISLRHGVDGLAPYLADKPDEKKSTKLRLCFNESLFGPSPLAVEAVAAAAGEIHLYPDPGGWELKEALQKKHGIPSDQILLGNGADSLITLLSNTFLNPGDEVLFCEPTFPIYRSAARIALGNPTGIPLDSAQRFDLSGLLKAISPKTKLVYLCNPNNPTGTFLPADEMADFFDSVPPHVLIILDEAYVDFMDPNLRPPTLEWIKDGVPLVSLRTFSKAYGLAGIRIGYAMASHKVIESLYRVREPFSVSILAIKAATAALGDVSHYDQVIHSVKKERKRLQATFRNLGLSFIPSQANFIFVNLGKNAPTICQRLSDHGVLIRWSASWGMPDWARVTIGPGSANDQFLSILDKVLKSM